MLLFSQIQWVRNVVRAQKRWRRDGLLCSQFLGLQLGRHDEEDSRLSAYGLSLEVGFLTAWQPQASRACLAANMVGASSPFMTQPHK